jgi:hypothetical protein
MNVNVELDTFSYVNARCVRTRAHQSQVANSPQGI